MDINGEFFDGKTSASKPTVLSVLGEGMLYLKWDGGSATFPLSEVEVSSRLGNTPRYFNFPNGTKFETRDNDAVDRLIREHSQRELHGWQSWLHALESRMQYVVLALIVVVAFSWGMLKYALPAAAEGIAYALPQDIMQSATKTTLSLLDKHYLKPSELDAATKARLSERFEVMSAEVEQGFNYRLLFRKGGKKLGANAFALPSGTIVVTDELVAIAEQDEEIVAVLAHELGHVVHRHSLRQVLQNSAISLAVTYATGDVSSLVVALPVLLVEMGYSRRFEHEADQFAFDYLKGNGIPTIHFASILEGLEASHTERRAKHEETSSDTKSRVVDLFEYLSTHPPTAERVERFKTKG